MLDNKGSYKFNWHDETKLRAIIETSQSQSDVLRKIGLKTASNATTLVKYIAKYEIDTSHFTPYANRKPSNGFIATPLCDILIENSPHIDRSSLKRRLVKEGILEYKCAKCDNMGEWNGEPLTLHLEHKNGINNDNRRENLEFLCPNCHSQTSTYAGRNKHTNL
ncbi:MAG: HNH endonuclease [Methylotenera sp.]|nr:MAG: HNH endonuclease [Methylotenera sp.]